MSIGSSILFSTGYYQDANYNQTYDFDATNTTSIFPYEILVPTSQYTISIYDYDTGTDDFMGGFNFTPYSSTNGFPSVINLTSSNLEFKIYVTYIF
jgi:hypothetical protein